jgi:DNA repair protein RadC
MKKKRTSQFAEISVNYKTRKKFNEMPHIDNSLASEQLFRKIWSTKIEHVEEMYMILLNNANKSLGYSKISSGGTTGTLVDTKVIFQITLMGNASAFIIAHNHPSGNLKPSSADINLTKKIQAAGDIMEIKLLDHIILSKEGFMSMADEGII